MKSLLILLLLLLPAVVLAADVTLTWTAPSDNVGVVKYDGRWSTTKPDTTVQANKDAWWVGAAVIQTMPIPAAAGTTQTLTLTGFGFGTYYFVVRSKDAAGNWADWSNVCTKVVADITSPMRIIDLH